MYRKLIPTLLAAGLLVFGIGASGATAEDNQPPAPPTGCTVSTPNGSEQDAADAVANAADDVSQEAENQQGDDEQGDVQNENDQSGEQGDCNNQDDGDQGND
ncbi:MAG: hypothetical protein E6G45_08165 [Actinobacteria bacterium]|nr:MAG: hypothetical protein E6G45_08165 [Actinomycetota bacterium]